MRARARTHPHIHTRACAHPHTHTCKHAHPAHTRPRTHPPTQAVRRVGLRLPHECREDTAVKMEAAAIEEEDVLFEEEMSLESMFSALKTDEKFMGR